MSGEPHATWPSLVVERARFAAMAAEWRRNIELHHAQNRARLALAGQFSAQQGRR